MQRNYLRGKIEICLRQIEDSEKAHFEHENKANDIDLRNAKRFDSFSSVIFNSKIKYCCFNKKLNNTKAKNFKFYSFWL